jgi:hypothetical protein
MGLALLYQTRVFRAFIPTSAFCREHSGGFVVSTAVRQLAGHIYRLISPPMLPLVMSVGRVCSLLPLAMSLLVNTSFLLSTMHVVRVGAGGESHYLLVTTLTCRLVRIPSNQRQRVLFCFQILLITRWNFVPLR